MINLVIVLPDWNWYLMSLTIELNTVSNVGLIVQNEYTLNKVGLKRLKGPKRLKG